jgi:DNA-binding NarL/FixJ family response regulator
MCAMASPATHARNAFARRAWGEAYATLAVEPELSAADLERLAVAAHLVGRDDESAGAWERAHHARAAASDPDGAARCAAWLAIGLLLRGEMAQGAGWLARAARIVDEAGHECAARGYLLVPTFLEVVEGDSAAADAIADDIVDTAQRFGDKDLLALGLLCRGEAALAAGHTARGMNVFDEAMVAITTGEVSPIPAGIVYCGVIEACMIAHDLRRAAEWTGALDDWCAAQPDLVPYRGQCLVHRSQVLQAHGEWTEAIAAARHATKHLSQTAHPAVGLSLYQQAELHRLRGEFSAAERAYRAASEHGFEPAPGFALLRMGEQKLDAAVAAIRRMLDESRGQSRRAAMLAAFIDIMLVAGDLEAAQAAADELTVLVGAADVALLHAIADYATGSVRMAQRDASAALTPLRRACASWTELGMPYDIARARVQIGVACRALGDHDAADLEFVNARTAFERLGAGPDLDRVKAFMARAQRARPSGLTERECEVLRLVARGAANREIAAALVISEHTVGRHVQNIFAKVGVSSRAAATAYAYEHGLA